MHHVALHQLQGFLVAGNVARNREDLFRRIGNTAGDAELGHQPRCARAARSLEQIHPNDEGLAVRQLGVRHLQLNPLTGEDCPVFIPVKLEGHSRGKGQRHKCIAPARLRHDPAMRWTVSGKAAQGSADSSNQMRRFETIVLAVEKNLSALSNLSGRWIDQVHAREWTESKLRSKVYGQSEDVTVQATSISLTKASEQAQQRVLWAVEHHMTDPSDPGLEPPPGSVDRQNNS